VEEEGRQPDFESLPADEDEEWRDAFGDLRERIEQYLMGTLPLDQNSSALRDHRLRCCECAKVSTPEASGWRIYLDTESVPVAFCPDCAEREFGSP